MEGRRVRRVARLSEDRDNRLKRGTRDPRAVRRWETPVEKTAIHPEVLLISSVLQTGDIQIPLEAGIDQDYFHSRRVEWEWIQKFWMRFRKAPDKATFRAQFPDFPLLKSTDVDHGVEVVRQNNLRHQLTRSLNEVTQLLVADRPEDALDKMHSSISGFSTNGNSFGKNLLREHSEVFREAARRVELASTRGLSGVNTGFPTLNDRTGGCQPGDLWIMAARLGAGKTWSLVKMGTTALMNEAKVVFVTLEQTKAQIMFRFHTMFARMLGYSIKNRELMSGINLDLNYYRSFLADLPDRVPGELIVCDPSRGRVSPFTLATLIETHKPDVVYVDYITLMKKDSDEWQGVAKLSQETKEVALQYGTPIVCAAQINRLGEGGQRPPGVDKLSQSDSIGQDADVVVTARKYSNAARQYLLAKNRSGTDDVVFYSSFDPDNGLVEECSFDEARRLAAEAAIEEED